MTRFISTLFLAFCFCFSFAQLNNNGYYRVQNTKTGRYICVIDNKTNGVNYHTTDVDLNALITRFWDFAESSPASVIYAIDKGKNASGDRLFDLYAQGVYTHDLVGDVYLAMKNIVGNVYQAYGTKSGNSLYLSDEDWDGDEGYILTSGTSTRSWRIQSISATSDNYFGVKPTLTIGNKHYASFYASFPFTMASAGMKAYYVKAFQDQGRIALMKELTEVPAGTPVIIECSSLDPSDNRLNLLDASDVQVGDNLLLGAYFNINLGSKSGHVNRVAVDNQTMRLMGVDADGHLAMAESTADFVPANNAYLPVSSTTTGPVTLMTESEYETYLFNDIENPTAADMGDAPVDIYSATGVLTPYHRVSELPRGFYIVNGKKLIVK